MKFQVLILAAGKGTRMKSDLPKVIFPLLGHPLVSYILDTVTEMMPEKVHLVVGHKAGEVQEELAEFQTSIPLDFVLQKEQLGTGHAVSQAAALLKDYEGLLVVMPGDAPLISAQTLRDLLEFHEQRGYSATILSTVVANPHGYGRIIRNPAGDVVAIVEEKDADNEERLIREINSSIYCFNSRDLFGALAKVSADNAQGEYYLTDVISVLRDEGKKVGAYSVEDSVEVMGINNRSDLAQAGKALWRKKAFELMASGVTVMDPETAYIHPKAEVGPDTVIYPCVMISEDCIVGESCQVGPFAYLRPGTRLADHAKVGDFVEIKNSVIGEGSKVPHHSYIGDAEIGTGVNIGAGTITCNYDGEKKYQTIIGDNVFIGSNSNLVAPVSIGDGAYVGAGSTITKDVPAESLGIARGKQYNKEGWAKDRRKSQ